MNERTQGKLTALFFVRDSVLPYIRCSPAAKAILLYLASFANPDGTSIFMGSRKIAEVTGYDRNTVKAALRLWLEIGILVLVKQGRQGSGHANEYRIALEKGELFTLSMPEIGGTIHPFELGKRVSERVNSDLEKGEQKGEQKGEPFTPTETPNVPENKTEAAEEPAPLTAAAASGIRDAFRELGFEEPFGDQRFQVNWAMECSKLPTDGAVNGGAVDAMERCAQLCKREGVPVPKIFFDIKRQVEKAEVRHRFEGPRPPL